MNKKDINYWEKRSAKRMWEHMESAEKASKEIAKYYYKSSNYLGGKMDDVFDRYQTKHGLSEAEAKRLLNQMHDKSSINDLKLALQQSKDSQEKAELLQLLESPAYASRLQRFEELQQQLDDIMTNTYNIEKQLSTEHYKSLATNSFYRPIYDLQKGTGLGFQFAHISESEIDKLLHSKWSGTNYSKRIWQNTTKLAHTVKEEMMISLMTGRTDKEVASVIQEKFGTGAFEARRLVRTESAFIVNEMEQQAYEECDIEKYMFVATLDKRTSEICQSMDHKVFKVKDRQPGVNCPPMHPFCRSTTIAYLDDETISNMERLATDEKGKKNKISANTSYEQWIKSVNGDTIEVGKEIYDKPANIGGLKAYPKKYHSEITNILNDAPDICRKAWNDVCEDFHTITGLEYKNKTGYSAKGSFYSSTVDAVYMNISKQSKGNLYQAPYQTVFHEFGHHMDYILNRRYGNGMKDKAFSEVYKQGIFGKTIKKEAEQTILGFAKTHEYKLDTIMDRKHVEKLFCDEIKDKYSKMERGDISDMFEPVMKSQAYPFGSGHGQSYWLDRDNGKEGFAEMYSAMVNNPESWKTIQKFFPNSVEIFIEMLKVVK